MVWTCARCTVIADNDEHLQCGVCGAPRGAAQPAPALPAPRQQQPSAGRGKAAKRKDPQEGRAGGWGFLKAPTAAQARMRRAPDPLTHLVVLDFEWTACNKRKVEPISEITQFPSVLVRACGACWPLHEPCSLPTGWSVVAAGACRPLVMLAALPASRLRTLGLGRQRDGRCT